MTPDPTEREPIVVGTDEDGETAFVWVETRHDGAAKDRPDGTLPTEDAARQAVVDTAKRDGWSPDALNPNLVRPAQLCWFKYYDESAADDETVACADDDPERQDRFWLWDISEAVWEAGDDG